MPQSQKLKPRTQKEYEHLGRMLENIYLTGYVSKRQMLKMSFVKGLVTGFGGIVGATLGIAALLWVLSLFDTIPLFGPFFENLQETIKTQK